MRIGQARNATDLIEALEAARQKRLEKRRPFEAVWWNNVALVAGDHYATWAPDRSTFVDTDSGTTDFGGKKPRIALNHAQTVARTELSKLTKSRPVMDVMANSDDADDLAATKVATKVLDALEWKLKTRKIRKDALWWMILTGMGANYVGYDYHDDSAGYHEFWVDPATDEPIFSDKRRRELEDAAKRGEVEAPVQEKYPLGEVEYKTYSPFQLLPDDTCTDFDVLKELICSDVWDIDVLEGCYPKTARDLQPEEVSLGVMETRMLQRLGMVPSAQSQAADDAIQVHTWWCEPGMFRANPYLRDGKMIRWCQGRHKLEESEAFPYQDGRLPFAFYQHIPSALSIWPRSVIEDIREANLEIDKTVSQLIENKDFMANPMWLIATQHRIKGKVKNVAGSIVRYTHVPNVPPPQPVQGMQMPSQVENLVVALRDQILDISGQSEVSRGRMPSGVRSGVQVAYMQEEDDTKIAPTVENMELAVSLESSLLLERVSQFYYAKRVLTYYRKDGIFDVVRFMGADLKNNTAVVTQMGSAMPKSKAARQQYTLELASLGIETNPKRLREMLELGYAEPDDDDKTIAQANRENQIMLHGAAMGMFTLDQNPQHDQEVMAAAVPVYSWQNHQLHIQRHTSIMMDEEFDHLQISHPEIVRLFNEHIAMHQQALQQQQMEQMQMTMAMRGAPDGPPQQGGAPPPGQNGSNGAGQGTMTQLGIPDTIGSGALQISNRQFPNGAPGSGGSGQTGG